MSNEPLIPYLPKLIKGTEDAVAPPRALREWDDSQGEIRLRHLADAIEVPPGADRVHSIPDPWARVILFWRALYDRDHSLHRRIRGEWRGALTLLALKEVRRVTELGVHPMKLKPNDAHRESFRYAVTRVLPGNEDAIIRSATWNEFDLLRWTGERTQGRERAFALTSPWTLVATGANYSDVFSKNEVPWFDGKCLADPVGNLSEDERAMVAEWLWHVRNGLPAERGAKIREIAGLLESFARDLHPAANGLLPASEVFADRSLGLSGGELYRWIDRPCRPTARIVTHCAIRTDRQGAPEYILIDPAVTAAIHRNERDVVVHRSVNMATYRRLIPEVDRSRSGLLNADFGMAAMRWCTAEFFFEKDLIYQQTWGGAPDQKVDAFPGLLKISRIEGRAQGRQFVLPIRPEVLGLFTAETLASRLSMEWTEKGDAQFRLRLDVRTLAAGANPQDPAVPTGEMHTVELVRTYSAAEMVQVPRLPAVCLWPNFRFEDDQPHEGNGGHTPERAPSREAQSPRNRWNVYYLFESWRELGDKIDQFVVSALPGEAVNERLLKMPTYDAGQKIGEEAFQITSLTSFPEALVCKMPFNTQRQRSQGDVAPTGLLLLHRPPPTAVRHDHHAALGMDFGTTGTSIWRSFGPANAEDNDALDISRVSFENRVVQITTIDVGEFQRITRELFVPNKQPVNGRILSIFQDFGGRGKREAVRDGHVLFLENSGSQEFVHGDPQSVLTNLKWSEERGINAATQDFLIQLCRQSLAELIVAGATTIDLRYSYPTAFSEDDLEHFKGLWTTVAGHLKRDTSVPIRLHERIEDNCEAIAATRFFSHSENARRINVARGAITLDIGGGTTDIAVWNRHPESGRPSLLGHMSVKFAGQDIFLAPLRHRPQLLAQIDDGGTVSAAIELLTSRFRRGPAYDAELDAIITAHGDELLEKLPGCAQSRGIKEFLQILDLGLCGIAFYTGLLVGRLVKDGSYDALQPRIQTFVGGNGSRLFNWCALGEADRSSKIVRRFAATLLAGANLASGNQLKGNQVEVSLSSRPKEEVAFGLVMRPDRLERNDAYVNPIAGENYLVGKVSDRRTLTWDTAPDLQTLGTLPVHVDPKLEVFKTFLQAMELRLSEEELYDVGNAIDTGISNMAVIAEHALKDLNENGKKDPVRKQPLFILGVKHLISDRIRKLSGTKQAES